MSRESSRYDLIVVGSGIAGLTAALTAAADRHVALVSKSSPLASSSWLAQGGVAAAFAGDDSPALHEEDTLRAGRGLCRGSAVRAVTEEAPARIVDLVELGVPFDDGLGLEGGHSRRRIVHSGGAATGERIARTLAWRAFEHSRIDFLGERLVTGLWSDGDRCTGVLTDGGPVAGRATVLATGGMAALWERTTNPAGSVGEGVALAYRAGAPVADLELVQFHPTVLAENGLLLSEALRGEGAVLLDHDGCRFTDELAPRDVVARAIDERGTALLDLRRIDRGRFAILMEKLHGAGYDPASEPIPVAPAAHYTMGGIVADLDARTELPGLYAAGECACTGLHGANRLASNSLLEGLVFGGRAGRAMQQGTTEWPAAITPGVAAPPASGPAPVSTGITEADLRELMWTHAAVFRDRAGLEQAAGTLRPLRAAFEDALANGAALTAATWRIGSLLTVGSLVVAAALRREESRGAHWRTDFPASDGRWKTHTGFTRSREEN
jgi:L-aspartate oxidase